MSDPMSVPFLSLVIAIGVGLVLGVIPGLIGRNKNWGFGALYCFGVFFFVPALIVALCLRPREDTDGDGWYRPQRILAVIAGGLCLVAFALCFVSMGTDFAAMPFFEKVRIPLPFMLCVLVFVGGVLAASRKSVLRRGTATAAATLAAFAFAWLTLNFTGLIQGGLLRSFPGWYLATAALCTALALIDENRVLALVAGIIMTVFAFAYPLLSTVASAGVGVGVSFTQYLRTISMVLRRANGWMLWAQGMSMGLASLAIVLGLPEKTR